MALLDVSASPPKVRLDADGWTIEKIVEQMDSERDHFRRAVQKLESDIHTMNVSQQAQMADVTGIIKDAQRQSKEMESSFNFSACPSCATGDPSSFHGIREARGFERSANKSGCDMVKSCH